ncbi:MAG: lysophospholipid acyltransferase family protein [Steroidobacteraceae bacterium]
MSLRATSTPRFVPAPGAGWRFATAGRWLLWRAATSIAGASTIESTIESTIARHRLQQLWADRILRHLDVDLRIERETALPDKPHIVVALHEGMLDPLCLLQLGQPMRFVARREIFDLPGMGRAIAAMDHIAIDPEHGTRAYRALRRQTAATLARGEHLVVFAQGTILGIETALRRGAFELAAALGCDLLPIVIAGTHRVWEHPFSAALRYGQPVWMRVLAPVAAPPRDAQAVEQLRLALQHSLKDRALAQRHAPVRRYVPSRDGYWDGYAFEIDPRFARLHADIAARRTMIRAA